MSDHAQRLAIGLKYCGGCKANYDRVALAAEIARRLDGRAVLVRHDHPDAALILALQGCPTACADLAPFEHLTVYTITRPEEAEAFIGYVQNWLHR